MRRFPTSLVCLVLMSFTSLACLGGCPGQSPGRPDYLPPIEAIEIYAPDVVGIGEPFPATITARQDDYYGSDNPDVEVSSDRPQVRPEPSRYPVTYSAPANSHKRTIEVANEMTTTGEVNLTATRTLGSGNKVTASKRIYVVPFQTWLERPAPFTISPGETKEVDATLTVEAWQGGTASVAIAPVDGYTITPIPAAVEVPIGRSVHTVRLRIVASGTATNSGTDLSVTTTPPTPPRSQGRAYLQLLQPTEGSLTLEVTPAQMVVRPNQLSPDTTLTIRGSGGIGGIINVDVERVHYLRMDPSSNPIGFNLEINGMGQTTHRWLWDGFTGTPSTKTITYSADVDGKRYTATQTLTFRWGE